MFTAASRTIDHYLRKAERSASPKLSKEMSARLGSPAVTAGIKSLKIKVKFLVEKDYDIMEL